jgi:glyoxylate/hydroxypyruvate reductase A
VTGMADATLKVLIASFLEADQVERIRRVDPRLEVIHEPELLRPPRYAADHKGGPMERTPEGEARWRRHLADADILFDFDQTHLEDLPELAPKVRWIQATSSGIAPFVQRMGYARRMPGTVFTRASGVHAQPLAEFCLMVMLLFRKGLHRILRDQERKHWERNAGTDLEGRTLVVVGLGGVGRAVARTAKALGMHVIGVERPDYVWDPNTTPVDEIRAADELQGVLDRAGAGLDVFAEEPLPPESPFWEMPNVLVSPHSASTSDRENRRLTDLFCGNLRRFLAGEPLVNVLDLEELGEGGRRLGEEGRREVRPRYGDAG